jgi:hypothetical protein
VIRAGRSGSDARADQIRYARELLLDVKEERALADTKAALLLAGVGVIASVGASAIFGGAWTPGNLSTAAGVLWWIGNAGLVGAILLLAGVVYPRTSSGSSGNSIDTVAYFGEIRLHAGVDSLRAALTRSASDELTQLTRQLLRTSQLTARKYQLIRIALWSLLGSLSTYLASIAVEVL